MEVNELFGACLGFILAREGGYTNDPSDPGGATNYGVTTNVYNAYRKSKNQPVQSVKDISHTEVADIYLHQYWDASGCDAIASHSYKIAAINFDTAINCGVGSANRLHRTALDNTVNSNDIEDTINEYLKLREEHYREIVANRPKSAKFLKGWLNRIAELKKFIADLPS